MKNLIFFLLPILVQNSHASVIAIIDSGTDLSHPQLEHKKWNNPGEVDDGVDNDDNGYIDDLYGWNFADQNNKLYEKKMLGTFSSDVYLFFEIQTRLLKGEGTDADRAWMQAARTNQKLIAELGVFGNFVHGTHVAGLAAKNADRAEIMVLKVIPTKPPLNSGGAHHVFGDANPAIHSALVTAGGNDGLIKEGLKLLAAQQGKGMAPWGNYVAQEHARVANCSFGTSTDAAKGILAPLLKIALRREATPEELEKYSAFFVQEVLKASAALFEPSKGKTFFVIAAGNDGANNDQLPTSPANYKSNNTIAVAATLGYNKLASFSNFGESQVEVAAPGVGIESSIPGNRTLTVSGTSQAAPFVTNVVGLMLDENPNLSNSDIKQILIGSVDEKAFLKGKVLAHGIVNPHRAVSAARLALTLQLADAIQHSRVQVDDVPSDLFLGVDFNKIRDEGYVLPLPQVLFE